MPTLRLSPSGAPEVAGVRLSHPDRILWATDWPHSAAFPPDQNPRRTMPNDGFLLDYLAERVPDTNVRKKILVDNPASLYGFK